ncbi:MAG: thermonuclease family protein [Phycisphaerae bacterium]|jgi:micrococcal nuclease
MKNKNIFLLCAVSLLCVAAPYKFDFEIPVFEQAEFSNAPLCQVVRIIDGDTIVVDMNNQDVKIRLAGVKSADKYSVEMTSFTKNLLRGENVYIIDDPNQKTPDKFGYLPQYVYRAPDGLFVNAEIIRQGYGRADTETPFKYSAEFQQLEKFAKERSKGFWDASRPEKISQPAPSPPPKASIAAAAPSVPVAPTLSPSPKTSAENNDIIVYVTKTGKKYHLATCGSLSKSSIPIKLSDAKARGYTPCSRCNPPQ